MRAVNICKMRFVVRKSNETKKRETFVLLQGKERQLKHVELNTRF